MLPRPEYLALLRRLRWIACWKPGLSAQRRKHLMEIASCLQSAREALDKRNAAQNRHPDHLTLQ